MLLCDALKRHTGHKARLVTLETRYNHNFNHDIHIPDADETALDEVNELFKSCDILHFHMTADEFTSFGPFLPADYLHDKLIVHHHHGHPDFRANPEKYRKKYKERHRRNLLVSTPDLLRLLPEALWQPNTVPVDDPAYSPAQERLPGPLRIGHSPTNKTLKNTEEFLRVTENLTCDAALPANERVFIDNVPHAECLRLKRNCDIFFDHMQGYFGLSSLEALSQGVPTIAGLDEWNMRHIEEFAESVAPWIIARGEENLKEAARSLIQDEGLRRAKGAESRKFMEKGWHDSKTALRLNSFYNNLQ